MPEVLRFIPPISFLPGSNYTNLQDMHNLLHSAGWINGGMLTDNGDGTIDIAVGDGLIRAIDDSTSTLYFMAWTAATSLALTDQAVNYILIDYNAGFPQPIATVIPPTNWNSQFLLHIVYRDGNDLTINDVTKQVVKDAIGMINRRFRGTEPFEREAGGIISEVGIRNIAINPGTFWEALTQFITPAFDSSVSDTFDYWGHVAGVYTNTPLSTQIDNLFYDDGNNLVALTPGNYGVHWVYLFRDGKVAIIYGLGDYNLTDAQNAEVPSSIPVEITVGARLIGKIIIGQGDNFFTLIQSAFDTTFNFIPPTDHANLTNLDFSTAGHTGFVGVVTHPVIRQLIHFIDNGPAEGFATGAFREILPIGDPFPTSITWWTSAAKIDKIVEKTIAYNANKLPITIEWKMYDTDGSTVLVTVTDAITYSGIVFEHTRTRSIV